MKLPRSSLARIDAAFAALDLGDPRRDRRLRLTMAKLAKKPRASFPEAMEDEAELEGAYRLANNPAVDPQLLFASLARATAERARGMPSVLVLHDTTQCAFPDADPKEIGYLNTGKAGFHLHHALVLEGGAWRRPVGIANVEIVSRKQRSKPKSKPGSGPEFARWEHGVAAAAEVLSGCKHVCHVADREGDSYAFMAAMVRDGNDFVVRVQYDRKVRLPDALSEPAVALSEHLRGLKGVLEREVPLSERKAKRAPAASKAHPPREARTARLSFAASTVELTRPHHGRDPLPKTLTLRVVHVIEVDPPEGESPVEWRLFTTLPIDTSEQVATVVDNYRARWTIEEFHMALKTGCAYEEREFETLHALLVVLAISMPIACEILWLRSRARHQPNAPASEVLTPRQLQVLRHLGSRRLPPNPTARDALWAVAGLGGHLKRNGEPGWLVLYRGMQTLITYEAGFEAGLLAQKDA